MYRNGFGCLESANTERSVAGMPNGEIQLGGHSAECVRLLASLTTRFDMRKALENSNFGKWPIRFFDHRACERSKYRSPIVLQ